MARKMRATSAALGGRLSGRTFWVGLERETAVARAESALLDAGFRPLPVSLDQALAATGSAWIVRVCEIGVVHRLWGKNSMLSALRDVIPVSVTIPALRPEYPLTRVVASARTTADGATELTVMPLEAFGLGNDVDGAAHELVSPVLAGLEQDFRRDRVLVDVASINLVVADKANPAHGATFRRLLKQAGLPR